MNSILIVGNTGPGRDPMNDKDVLDKLETQIERLEHNFKQLEKHIKERRS